MSSPARAEGYDTACAENLYGSEGEADANSGFLLRPAADSVFSEGVLLLGLLSLHLLLSNFRRVSFDFLIYKFI